MIRLSYSTIPIGTTNRESKTFASGAIEAETVISAARSAPNVHQIFVSRGGADFCDFWLDAKLVIFGSWMGNVSLREAKAVSPARK